MTRLGNIFSIFSQPGHHALLLKLCLVLTMPKCPSCTNDTTLGQSPWYHQSATSQHTDQLHKNHLLWEHMLCKDIDPIAHSVYTLWYLWIQDHVLIPFQLLLLSLLLPLTASLSSVDVVSSCSSFKSRQRVRDVCFPSNVDYFVPVLLESQHPTFYSGTWLRLCRMDRFQRLVICNKFKFNAVRVWMELFTGPH